MERGVDLPGADLYVDSEVPSGAGLSSSAAIQTAVALALSALANRPIEGRELAKVAHRCENEFVGVPCGIMDQMISALGRKGHALLLDTKDSRTHYVPFDPARSGLSLMVIDTGAAHHLRNGEYAQRRRSCQDAAAALGLPSLSDASFEDLDSQALTAVQVRRARHVLTENRRVLEVVEALSRADFEGVGSAFVRSHASLRDDYEVSSPELDLTVEAALAAGAWGARMTGGGFGGSAIALVPQASSAFFVDAVTGAFSDAGFARPRIFAVTAESRAAVHLQ
jgi:galactokinase